MKRFFALFFSVILLLSMIGCGPNPNNSSNKEPSGDPANPELLSVNLAMTAYLVGTNGTVLESFPLGIQGTIKKDEAVSYLRLEMTTPEEFAYRFDVPEPNGYISQREDFFRDGDYRIGGFCYNKEENSIAGTEGMINIEKEYLIIYWLEYPGYYLVAATDSNATSSDITAYFTEFAKWIAPFLQYSIQIDWTMYGTWVTAEAVTVQKVDFSIAGTVTENRDGVDVLDVNIDFPDSFNYGFEGRHDPYTSQSGKKFGLEYYVCATYCYDRNLNVGVFSYFALSTEREFAIFYWENYPTHFLVASKDPNADPAEILSYFQECIEKYHLGD